MKQRDPILAAASGAATLVIRKARVVNVFTREILQADVALWEDTIIGVGEGYRGEEELDAEGAYLCPGFIDAHVHVESSMVIPDTYARVVMPQGTTTIIADPHEIANVAGAAGIRAMYKLTEGLQLRVYFMLPSCVPSTPFETAGAALSAEDMEQFMGKSRILGLGEVMDVGSAVGCEREMLDKLRLFGGRPIDGHAPLLSGRALNAYRVAGPSTDHECSNIREVVEKLRTGMGILLRVGSAARGMEELFAQIARLKLPLDNMMFCTDDKHIEDIRREGHINRIARMAVDCGIGPVDAVRMASYNAARAYGLRGLGAIAPGYKGDMVLFEDLRDFKVKGVFNRFGRPFSQDPAPMPILARDVYDSVHIAPLPQGAFDLPVRGPFPVIRPVDGQLITRCEMRQVPAEDGLFKPGEGLVKLAVLERHRASGNIGLGVLGGMPIQNGAIAGTVGHDSHNLIVAGDNDEDMRLAVESLVECRGGYCVVSRGVVLARLPLPIGGLMSAEPVERVLAMQRVLLEAAASLGLSARSDPLITLSFLALPVIPEIRLTDRGLFDSLHMKFYDLGGAS